MVIDDVSTPRSRPVNSFAHPMVTCISSSLPIP